MLLKVFAVYDSKSEMYSQPSFVSSRGAALRAFTDSIADKNTAWSKHPEDYTLFEIGEYDDLTAKMVAHPTPISLGVAIEFLGS